MDGGAVRVSVEITTTPVDVLRHVNEGQKAHEKLSELSRELDRGEQRKTGVTNTASKHSHTPEPEPDVCSAKVKH